MNRFASFLRVAIARSAALVVPAAVLLSAPSKAPMMTHMPRATFTRYIDRTEGAFLALVPRGWTVHGGIVRINALAAQGGVGNAAEAKLDFAVLREPEGRVAIRWLPKINYAQPSSANAMLGGNWNGMPILAMPRAADYLSRLLFPHLRPKAIGARILGTEQRPDIVASVRQLPLAQSLLAQHVPYTADAATVTVAYQEGGIAYRELLFVALEGYSYMGAGLWQNTLTIAARAPEAEFAAYGPVAKTVVNSFSLNPVWLQAEMQGQVRRAELVQATLRDISRVDAEIARSRSETMSAINREQYLTLTGQELYVNPRTGSEELGSGEWKHRWVDASGTVIYTDDADWDPNLDPELRVSGFERTPVKKR